MALPEGMVAVVHSLPDAGLAVSLLEGCRQYTLMPNSAIQTGEQPIASSYAQVGSNAMQVYGTSTEMPDDVRVQQGAACHSGTQAVDGGYASVYQMAHCNVKPTSPPVLLTEFPPQRAELCRGQGNFEVGGCGSGGINQGYTRANGNFRGAMVWPERGSVCVPKATTEPDAFAQSLRRYPNLSPERSSEMVDRLINYTQPRGFSPVKCRSPCSPSRSVCTPSQVVASERRSTLPSLAASLKPQPHKLHESEPKAKIPDDSPTKDISKKNDYESIEYRKPSFGRTFDVRHFRDCRRIKDSCKTNFVKDLQHKETQAEIPMISREVATLPRPQPSTRNVAVSLSSSSPLNVSKQLQGKWSCKSIQTSKPCLQTCLSSIDVNQSHEKKVKSCRKSKSQEELRVNDDLEQELLQLIKEVSSGPDNQEFSIRNELLKKLKKMHNAERSDKYRHKFGKCIRDQLYSQMDFKIFTRELSNELISKIKANNMVLSSFNPMNNKDTDLKKGGNEDNGMDDLIKEWLDDIPMKPLDYLGRHVNKDHVVQTVAVKIKSLVMNNLNHNCYNSLKPELFDILEDIPIEVNASNRLYYLNRIVDNLLKKIDDVCFINGTGRKRWNRTANVSKSARSRLNKDLLGCKRIHPTESKLKMFVQKEIKSFTVNFHLKICPSTEQQIQVELLDILLDSVEEIKNGNSEPVKEEILNMLSELIVLSEHEGIHFVNTVTNNFKNMLKESFLNKNKMEQTFVVLQNALQNTSKQTQNQTDFSIEGISDQDILDNLNLYTNLLVQQINEWMENVQGLSGIDGNHKTVLANDLATEIVERHKYLELNPKSNADADDSEHLKYQIFKWINKLVEEDNLDTITQASQLMKKIQNIPVPMLTRPIHNVNTSIPSSSEKSRHNKTTRNSSKKIAKRDNVIRDSPKIRDDERATEDMRDDSQINKTNYTFQNKQASENLSILQEHSGRDSSPGTVSDEAVRKPKVDFIPTNNFGVITDPNGSLSLKRVSYANADTKPVHPLGANKSAMEAPKEKPSYRRYSGPPGFPSSSNAQTSQSCCQSKNTPLPHCNQNQSTGPRSIKQLNDEYDQYLQNWVQQIPIITSNPEDKALIEKMRLGIYSGIWKALTKLHMDPTNLENAFYYQDVLDDEIEELLNMLPQSKELTKQKQILTRQLIEKTIQMNQQIFNSTASSSYKQQLIDNVANTLPRKALGFAGSDLAKICEEIHKLNMAEAYIMFTMYRETDKIKANAYRKKLMKNIQEFFDTLKRTQGVEGAAIDVKTYTDEIMSALAKVPLPGDETIREEGEEILIGLEIEQWFSDLPLYPTDNNLEILCRKRYRDTLAKKVHDIERQSDLNDCEDELRHEIVRFMAKLPIRSEDLDNVPFMVEELVNRLKNKPKDLVSGSRRVIFFDPNNYDEFSRDIPVCSSFAHAPGEKPAQINESSYMIVDGDRIPRYGSNVQGYRNDALPSDSQQEWMSLVPDSAHEGSKQLVQGQRLQTDHGSGYPMMSPHKASGVQTGTSYVPGQIDPHHVSGSHWDPYQALGRQTDPHRISEVQMDPTQASGVQMGYSQASQSHMDPPVSRREMTSHGQDQTGKPSQLCACSQTPANLPRIHEETGGPPAYGVSYRQPAENMERSTCVRPDQYSDMPRLPETRVSGVCPGRSNERPGHGSDRSSPEMPGTFPRNVASGTNPKSHGYQANSTYARPSRSPSTGASRGLESDMLFEEGQGFRRPQGTGLRKNRPYPYSPSDAYGQPMGYSTPQQNVPPPRESRPKKRTREVDREAQDAVRRRLHTYDSDESLKEEVRCRCMERVWRCRKKRSLCSPCDDCEVEFPACFRYPPYSYYF